MRTQPCTYHNIYSMYCNNKKGQEGNASSIQHRKHTQQSLTNTSMRGRKIWTDKQNDRLNNRMQTLSYTNDKNNQYTYNKKVQTIQICQFCHRSIVCSLSIVLGVFDNECVDGIVNHFLCSISFITTFTNSCEIPFPLCGKLLQNI